MFNPFMHPRNPFRARSDFAQLATKYPAFRSVSKCNLDGSVSVNFQDRESVRILSQTLLWDRLALDVQIPANSLVPTLPLRMNYLLWIQDMINENVEYFGSKPIWGLDTGVGACSIYPLLGAQQFHWHFIGTEVDEASLHSAQQNIERNHLDPLIKLILTENAETTPFFATPVAQAPDSHLHFTMCNPPFFEDPSKSPASEDSSETTWPSREKAKSPREYPAGSEGEIQTSGGEVGFVARMIDESVEFQEQIAIFTCMVGHKANLDTLRKKLYAVRSQHALKFIFTEFCQGTRLRWGVAWTFNPAVKLIDTSLRKKREKPYEVECEFSGKPISCEFSGKPISIPSLETLFRLFSKWMSDVKVDVVPGAVTSECVTCAISTYKTEWRHQRRRRREEKRQQQEDQGPPSKKIRIEENEASNGGNGEIQLRCSITMIQRENSTFAIKMKLEEGALGKVAVHEILNYVRNKYKATPD
ncbi:U6 small nuclear RNA (adenine-(43)-N(6))-methyltransferase-like [Tigriopus californicus]|uniref:U6 small nuclear RNA (adenine-(43)-N(6))-methyltransferase-like n=1 Tax=Tigriopus californicus TaxID=6832 RepID=UPI0027DA54E9|nr:U6 small nuclear RNA (adenine-(43)-N(6))-methyltransferase-like [Tigriopus californicus]